MSQQSSHLSKALEGRKVVFVVSPTEYRDEELNEPKKRLDDAGAVTSIASTLAGPCRGMLGGTATATLKTADLKGSDWDSVVIVGGMGSPDYLWNDAPLLDFLRQMNAAGKPVAGICLSGAVLANAGILEGRRATVWPDPKAIAVLQDRGAIYEKASVVQDGPIITAEGPHSAVEFAEKIADALQLAATTAR